MNGNLTGFGPELPLSVNHGQTVEEALPEPGAIMLLVSGLVALALIRRRKAVGV